MANRDVFQRYLDAGVAFTNMTRARAEELVAELVNSGEFSRGEARARADELFERSRAARETFVAQVRREVDHQLGTLGFTSLEELARQVASVLQRTADVGRQSTGRATSAAKKAAKKGPAKKSAAKKAPAKKASAKKAAKKSAAKKTPAKKSSAKKASAKKSSAKKTAAKKASAKKAGRTSGRPGPRA